MEIYKPFSIVVVPFPFVDSKAAKKRPALVLSSSSHQTETGHITLLMITSAKHSHWKGDHEIIDLNTTGLKAPSIIRQKIFTVDLRLIKNRIGELSKKDKEVVIRYTQQHLKIFQ